MAIFDVLAVLMVLAATFGWVNDRYARLPSRSASWPWGSPCPWPSSASRSSIPPIKVDAERLLAAIDFDQLLLHGALGFLLFAGALHIEFGDLRRHRVTIGVLAVVGTLLSTVIVGGLCWLFTRSLDLGLTPYHCLLFGALISPTDPIAVLGMLKSLGRRGTSRYRSPASPCSTTAWESSSFSPSSSSAVDPLPDRAALSSTSRARRPGSAGRGRARTPAGPARLSDAETHR